MWKFRWIRVVTVALTAALAVTAGAMLVDEGDPPDQVVHDVVLPASDPPRDPESTTTATTPAPLPSLTASTAGRPRTTSTTRAPSTTSSTAPVPATAGPTSTTVAPPKLMIPAPPPESEVAFTCSPDAVILPKRQPVTINCTATSIKGYVGGVYFGCSATDSAVDCGALPMPFQLTAGQSRTVAFQLVSRTPYSPEGPPVTVSITAYPNGEQRRRTVTISASIPGVGIACAPGDVIFSYYGPAVTDCTLSSHYGFAGEVTPFCQGLPEELYCSMSARSVTVPANGTATVRITFGMSSGTSSGTFGFYVVLAGVTTNGTLYHLTVP
jgi:hypothetical protein